MNVTVVLSIINGLILAGTALTGWLGYRAINRKTLAEAGKEEATAAELIVKTTKELLQPLRDQQAAHAQQIEDLTTSLADARAELKQTKTALAEALRQLAELKGVEQYLRERVEAREIELEEMRAKAEERVAIIEKLRERVAHLEGRLRDAGINGATGDEDL